MIREGRISSFGPLSHLETQALSVFLLHHPVVGVVLPLVKVGSLSYCAFQAIVMVGQEMEGKQLPFKGVTWKLYTISFI